MSFDSISNCLFKFLIIGDASVGKTSIIKRFCLNEFSLNPNETIGVEFIPFTIVIDKTPLKLQIWDTAGQEKYRTLSRSYYRNAIGVLIVFSFTDYDSFYNLDKWFDDVRTLCHPMAHVIVIGNKSDLIENKAVSKIVAEDFSKTHNVQFIEASAKTNQGIQESFYKLTRSVASSVLSGDIILSRSAPLINNNYKNNNIYFKIKKKNKKKKCF